MYTFHVCAEKSEFRLAAPFAPFLSLGATDFNFKSRPAERTAASSGEIPRGDLFSQFLSLIRTSWTMTMITMTIASCHPLRREENPLIPDRNAFSDTNPMLPPLREVRRDYRITPVR